MNQNIKTAVTLTAIAVAMFGFGYAMVPLYDVFCDAVGLNGKTGEISVAEASRSEKDATRIITVQFDTNVNSELRWRFGADAREMQVHPGEINEAFFFAENLTGHSITGQAVPSVAPFQASVYFNKTECFCFTRQTLGPHERREMPVRFIIDPALPDKIRFLTLSYTFFQAPGTDVPGGPVNDS